MSDWTLEPTELATLPARLLVFGAMGQVGRATCQLLGQRAQAVSRESCDLANAEALRDFLDSSSALGIINAAAYTAVDKAEDEPKLAHAINEEAPRIMAEYAAAQNIPLVHFSTDYVYDGKGEAPHSETDVLAPLNSYGKSKAAGDAAVLESGAKALIFRTSWVYDGVGHNFLRTMLRLGAQKQALSVVNDQWGAPSYAPHLAVGACKALAQAMQSEDFPDGVYHLVNEGCVSWHGFAEGIFAQARARNMRLTVQDVTGIPSSDYPTPAIRPQNSRLSTAKLQQQFGFTLPAWQTALVEAMEVVESLEGKAVIQ